MDTWKWGSVYFAMLGAVVVWFGCWELARSFGVVGAWATQWLKLSPEGMNWMCMWRGAVTFLAGLLIMFGSFRFSNIECFGTSVVGSIMLWILAGSDVLKMICSSIPGTGSWLNTFHGFLESYAPPYPAATWLLPFSLVMIYFIASWDNKSISLTKKEENVQNKKKR